MPLNIRDAEDTSMGAEAKFNDWTTEFEQNWNMPFAEMQIAMLLAQTPPAVIEQLYKRAPDAMGYLVDRIENRKVNDAK